MARRPLPLNNGDGANGFVTPGKQSAKCAYLRGLRGEADPEPLGWAGVPRAWESAKPPNHIWKASRVLVSERGGPIPAAAVFVWPSWRARIERSLLLFYRPSEGAATRYFSLMRGSPVAIHWAKAHGFRGSDITLDVIDIPAQQGFAQPVLAATVGSGKLTVHANVQTLFATGRFNVHAAPGSISLREL